MKAFAKVIALCPIISGMSDNGNDWEKQTVVFETLALEPQTLAVEFMGERKTKQTKTLKVGQQVEVNFVIRCNEYQDKWYTRLDGMSVRPLQAETPASAPAPAPAGVQATMEMPPAPATAGVQATTEMPPAPATAGVQATTEMPPAEGDLPF